MDPDRIAALESERKFLLRSLEDLEREHAAGDVDDADYAELKDGYTRRAADVLRALQDGVDARRAAIESRRRPGVVRRALMVASVAVVAGAIGWLVAAESGQRLPGQVATGGNPGNEVAALLSEARTRWSTDPIAAIEIYDLVLEREPDTVEALTYRSWLLVLISSNTNADVQSLALDQARAALARAIEVDPSYPDARCLAGVVEVRFGNDPEAARPQLATCLESRPPAEVRGLVEGLLAAIDAGEFSGAAPSTSP
jgi:tetratricopeptide (TPR) repeat protein